MAKDMYEFEAPPGIRIDRACRMLAVAAQAAPAFMVFNGTRIEARPGETADQVFEKWCEHEKKKGNGQ